MAEHLSGILGDTLLTTLLDGQVPQQLPSPQVRICLWVSLFFVKCTLVGVRQTGIHLFTLIYHCVIL